MSQPDVPISNNDSTIILPPNLSYTATLTQLLKGAEPVLKNAVCQFKINNSGSAQLNSINEIPVRIHLYPLGIAGQEDFMSDMKPTAYTINGVDVIIYRVILDSKPSLGLPGYTLSAAIMFNQDGSCIEATESFNETVLSSASQK